MHMSVGNGVWRTALYTFLLGTKRIGGMRPLTACRLVRLHLWELSDQGSPGPAERPDQRDSAGQLAAHLGCMVLAVADRLCYR